MTDTVITVTANYAAAAGDRVILVDSTSAAVIVTLPAPVSGRRFSIKDYGATGLGYSTVNQVSVDPLLADIDGVSGTYLLSNNEGLNLIGTGTDWAIVV